MNTAFNEISSTNNYTEDLEKIPKIIRNSNQTIPNYDKLTDIPLMYNGIV